MNNKFFTMKPKLSKAEIRRILKSENLPKFKFSSVDDIKSWSDDEENLVDIYLMHLDRIEYAFYTNTYPYPICALSSEKTYTVIISMFDDNVKQFLEWLMNHSYTIENEFFEEAQRIKTMLRDLNKGVIKDETNTRPNPKGYLPESSETS